MSSGGLLASFHRPDGNPYLIALRQSCSSTGSNNVPRHHDVKNAPMDCDVESSADRQYAHFMNRSVAAREQQMSTELRR
jgi:hypothetical protein